MAAKIVLTPGENLVIWRRRRGFNQIEAAQHFKVHVDRYREWEADRETPPKRAPSELKPHEVCLICRRRSGMTQKELAKKIGCTRLWVIQMEDGSAPLERLKNFWKV